MWKCSRNVLCSAQFMTHLCNIAYHKQSLCISNLIVHYTDNNVGKFLQSLQSNSADKTITNFKNTINLDTDGRIHVFRGFFLFVLHYRKHQVLEARLMRTCRLHHTLTSFVSLYLWPCSNIRWSSM